MAVNRIERIDHYVRYLQQDAVEVATLFRELLIGVTSFFRDSAAFELLAAQVVPHLFDGKTPGEAIRVWVPGCSTGEEAYSHAILLQEWMDENEAGYKVHIFATDIDSHAIEKARAGVYPASIAADVSEVRLQRFFSQEGDHFAIKKNIRDMVIFARQNLISDPPFSKLDLISQYLGQIFARERFLA
jgi:two-component system CheB/CheR fusion protein